MVQWSVLYLVLLLYLLVGVLDNDSGSLWWSWLILAVPGLPILAWMALDLSRDARRKELLNRARIQAIPDGVEILLARVRESSQERSYNCAFCAGPAGLSQLRGQAPDGKVPWDRISFGGIEQSQLGLGKRPILCLNVTRTGAAAPVRVEVQAVRAEGLQNDPDAALAKFASACRGYLNA